MARITSQGLKAMALLVVLLWGCILFERSLISTANRTSYEALREIRTLRWKRNAEPVSVPLPRRPARPALG